MFYKQLEKLALSLEKRNIVYMLIGDQAVLLYGEPRLTKDIDVTIDIGPENVSVVLEIITELGWSALVDSPEKFVTDTMVLPCMEPNTGIRIEFIFSTSSYEKQAFKRVKHVLIGKANVNFVSIEDLIIHKIIAGSPRDIEDVKAVIHKNKNLDTKYIRKWLGQFDETLSQSYMMSFEKLWKVYK